MEEDEYELSEPEIIDSNEYSSLDEMLIEYAKEGYYPEHITSKDITLGYSRWTIIEEPDLIRLQKTIYYAAGQQAKVILRHGTCKKITVPCGIITMDLTILDQVIPKKRKRKENLVPLFREMRGQLELNF